MPLPADALRVYVAGPITKGDQLLNVAAGIDAAEAVLRAGFAPICPHSHSAMWHMRHPHTWEEWLALDYALISACHALYRMPGESKGADVEVAFAESRGIPVFCSLDTLCHYFNEVR